MMANPICVALDTPDIERACTLARVLKNRVGYMKLGMEFFFANGEAGYEKVAAEGLPIFLDLKLHDIPSTVAQGMTSLLKLEPAPAIVNVHAQGGLAMMLAARHAVGNRAKVIAVTVLTSLSNDDIWQAGLDPRRSTDAHALTLAQMAAQAELDGVVCSPLDLVSIRSTLPRTFMTVVPGIRPDYVKASDQKRIATPKAAIDAGADILVIGRAITGAADPVAATQLILEAISS
jgi:orotidine-5'-phosphate decarboxylase